LAAVLGAADAAEERLAASAEALPLLRWQESEMTQTTRRWMAAML
jgi:hypothetical protein